MSEVDRRIFTDALSLPPMSRAELAELLWASLPGEQPGIEPSEEIREAWIRESQRRKKEIDDGVVELVRGEEVMERLRRKMEP